MLLLLGCPPHSTGAAEPAPEYLDYHSDTPWRPWGRPQGARFAAFNYSGAARPPTRSAPPPACQHVGRAVRQGALLSSPASSRSRPLPRCSAHPGGALEPTMSGSRRAGGPPQLLPRRRSCRFHNAGMCWHCCSASGFCGKDAGDGLWCGEGNQPAYSYAKIDPSSNLCGKRPMPITSWVTRTSGTAFRQPISMPDPRGL